MTFAPLNLLGVSLNVMSLGGLALGIGMLVDSSIVVLESIFRCREEGDAVEPAAVRGTGEVRGAVVASTLTTIAVFFPMVFVEGVAGQAFGDLGLAVVMSLLASLVVAIFLVPMLASRGRVSFSGGSESKLGLLHFATWAATRDDWRAFFSAEAAARRSFGAQLGRLAAMPFAVLYFVLRFIIGSSFELVRKLAAGLLAGFLWLFVRLLWPALRFVFRHLMRWPLRASGALLEGLNGIYPGALRWALRRPGLIFTLVLATMGLTAWLLLQLDTELLPEVRQGEFTVEVALPVGTPLEQTDAVVSPVERAILAEREHIAGLLLTVGYDAANSNRSDEGEHTARFKVLLDRADPRTEDEVIERLRRRFAGIPDLSTRVVRPVLFSFKAPIEVEVHGEDLVVLRRQAERARDALAAMPELADVETSLRRGAPEVQVIYNRDLLARYDLNPSTVARLVRDKVQGFEATRFNLQDRRIPIVARLRQGDRETVADVRDLIVNPGGERPISLESVADVDLGEGPSEVRRVDGRRMALVTASIANGSLGAAVEGIRSTLDGLEWPSGTTFFIAGQNEEWERSKASLWLAMALSIFLVYVIMAAQFESLLHPFVILFSIPLAFFGTILTLGLAGNQPLDRRLSRHDHARRHRRQQRDRARRLHQHPAATRARVPRGCRQGRLGPAAAHPHDDGDHDARARADGARPRRRRRAAHADGDRRHQRPSGVHSADSLRHARDVLDARGRQGEAGTPAR